mmetsp:Transcript_18814/g.44349  ORF Transcript_18814/g.44349 Transcript_18814/m.44349 type:complete len:241 (+) Transcript_18814:1245-1967(+)
MEIGPSSSTHVTLSSRRDRTPARLVSRKKIFATEPPDMRMAYLQSESRPMAHSATTKEVYTRCIHSTWNATKLSPSSSPPSTRRCLPTAPICVAWISSGSPSLASVVTRSRSTWPAAASAAHCDVSTSTVAQSSACMSTLRNTRSDAHRSPPAHSVHSTYVAPSSVPPPATTASLRRSSLARSACKRRRPASPRSALRCAALFSSEGQSSEVHAANILMSTTLRGVAASSSSKGRSLRGA